MTFQRQAVSKAPLVVGGWCWEQPHLLATPVDTSSRLVIVPPLGVSVSQSDQGLKITSQWLLGLTRRGWGAVSHSQ